MASAENETSTKENSASSHAPSPDDWFLIRCSGCSGILKVPGDTTASSISCPTCDTILQLSLRDEEEQESGAAASGSAGALGKSAPAQAGTPPSIVKFGCPGCGEFVRLAIGDSTGVVACRACGQTIEYEFGDIDSPGSAEGDEWDPNSPAGDFDLESAIQLDPDRGDDSPYRHTSEFIDESLPQETDDEDLRIKTLPDGRKVRVRRKRKKRRGGKSGRDVETNITTWDSSRESSSRSFQDLPAGRVRITISKKRLSSDELNQIRILENTDGAEAPTLSRRRKRIRKADARARKINHVAMIVLSLFILCIVLALVGMAIFGGIVGVRDKADMTRIRQDLKVSREKFTQAELKAFDMERAKEAALAFIMADGLAEKLKHVRHPEIVRPRMEDYYQTHSASGLPNAVVAKYMKTDYNNQDIGWVEVVDAVIEPVRVPVERVGDEYKVDWEVSVGYQEKTIQEIRTEKPTTPFELTCNLSKSDYYNFDFLDKERYMAVEISIIGETMGKLVGYVERKSPLAIELSAMFAVKQPRGAIISVRFPENPASDNQVLIEEKIQDGFIKSYDHSN